MNLRAASLKSYFDRYAPSFELRVSMQKRTSGVRIEDIPLYGIPAIMPLIRRPQLRTNHYALSTSH